MKLSLCIVGCGRYARSVLNDIRDLDDEFQFFFADRDREIAKSYSESYGGAGYFGSYEEAADDPRVQAMYFLTPHDRHLDDATLAAPYRKHILMEKPIARTVAEATKLIRTAEAGGVKLMVAENFRFLPVVQKTKELIAQGAIGELRSVQVRREGYDARAVEWRTSVARNGGGRLIDGGIHRIDILVNLGGFPETVYALVESPKVLPDHEGEDGIVMVMQLPNDVTGMVHYSGGTSVAEPSDEVRVTGTVGVISFEPNGSELTLESRDRKSTVQVEPARDGVRRMVREFRDCIVEDREPLMSGTEALKDLAVVLAAYESAERGVPVTPSGPSGSAK